MNDADSSSASAGKQPASNGNGLSTTYVNAFGRGLAVIRCFSAETPRLTIADVAKATGLNRATARRFLYTLEAHNYVGHEGAHFFLRPRILELGYSYLTSLPLNDTIHEQLTGLANELHESVSAGVLDGDDVVYVARAQTSRVMTLTLNIGSRIPAYLTALGRMLLAGLPDHELDAYLKRVHMEKRTARTIANPDRLRTELIEVRQRGYCIIDEEIEVGVRAAAVPIHTKSSPSSPQFAISVSCHASRVRLTVLKTKYVPRLKAVAAEIERLLTFQQR
jgi:IclR family pca regulon transcriptional regulator